MRAACSTSLITLVLVACFSLTCAAEPATPDKPVAPQKLTGPGGKDVRDETRATDPGASGQAKDKSKEKAAAGSENRGRVNALSPEEKRRAARARERAAAKAGQGRSDKDAGRGPAEKAAVSPPAPAGNAAVSGKPAASAQRRDTKATVAPRRLAGSDAPARIRQYRHRDDRTAGADRDRRYLRGGPDGSPYGGPRMYRPMPGPYYVMRPPWRYLPRADYPAYPRMGMAYPPYPQPYGRFYDDDD